MKPPPTTFSNSLRKGLRLIGGVGSAVAVGLPGAHALVRWNDGREQVFVNLEASASWESNIFASAGGDGDVTYSANVGLDYQRRAGLIGINASASVASLQFTKYTSENAVNPNLTVELNKDSGRTTGAFSLSGVRESRADPAANLRTESWNYTSSLNLKYPVIERYSLAGSLGYNLRDFDDNTILVDLSSYNASFDLFYVFTSERDLIAGYRIRQSESSSGVTFLDHAFTAGVTGKILPKVSGTIRAGYQFRDLTAAPGGLAQDDQSSWTLNGSMTWTISQRLNFTGQLSKDFSVTSTDVSIDQFSATISSQYAISGKTTIFATATWTFSDYLSLITREDTNLGGSAGIGRTIGTRIKASIQYNYGKNWSTVDLSDFDRQAVSLTLSTRI